MYTKNKDLAYWFKYYQRRIRFQYRLMTWKKRVLPDFLIIGAQKSGTTSLYDYLSEHPRILPAFTKEIHFFDGGLYAGEDNYTKGEKWYRAFFPKSNEIDKDQQTFEASPLYLFTSHAPRRIKEDIPQVKLIAILRNPVERAISHYFHERYRERETLPILQAMKKEEERLAPILEKKDYKNERFIQCSYKKRGHYKEQLERYFQYFQRDQILVVSSEKLFSKPASLLKRIYNFLEIDADFTIKNLTAKNVSENRKKVEPEVYRYLQTYFRPLNEALFEFLGREFDW